jgi:hypothetical protein
MPSPTPVPSGVSLLDGEEVVLSGGPSWHAWLFSAALLPAVCALLPLFALPWIFTGHYWVTQLRLVWKPLGRKPRSVMLDTITDVRVVGRRATVSTSSPQGRVSMRMVEGWKRLWGALLLFRQLPMPERLGVPRAAFQGQQAICVEGKVHQTGYGIVHKSRFTFLPQERRHHLGADAAKVAGQVALALVGFHAVTYRADLPFDTWLSLWSHLSDDEFAALLTKVAAARGGVAVPVGQLEPVEGRAWYRHQGIEFRMRQPLA